jgi:hypothetical protein
MEGAYRDKDSHVVLYTPASASSIRKEAIMFREVPRTPSAIPYLYLPIGQRASRRHPGGI